MQNNTRIDCVAAAAIGLMLALFVIGCTVAEVYRDEPGVDVSSVRSNIDKTQVEAILGKPIRSWQSSTGIRYCLYEYDAGAKGSGTDAAFFAFMDAVTLGIFETIPLIEPMKPKPHTKVHIILSYDANDAVLGTFGEFDDLPPDGRSLRTGTSNRKSH